LLLYLVYVMFIYYPYPYAVLCVYIFFSWFAFVLLLCFVIYRQVSHRQHNFLLYQESHVRGLI